MAELTTGGLVISYEVHGSGPPIVFAHESTWDGAAWNSQVQYFGRFRTCIVYNARGYPPSAIPSRPEAYSQHIYVEDMLAVFDHLRLDSADIVGLSMGSMTALNFALRHPARAQSVVLAGTGPGQSRAAVEAFNERIRSLADAVESGSWASILDDYDAAPDRRNLRWKNPLMHRLHSEWLRARDGTVSATILRQVVCGRPVLAELEEELAALEVPVLLATGDQDPDCLPTSLFLYRVLPRVGLAVFPRTGHAVNLEEPALFNRLLETFYLSIASDRW